VTNTITVRPHPSEDYREIIDVVNIWNSEETNIVYKPGTVLVIDFWATWCEPCLKPMAHNQKILETRGADWGDKVRIVAIAGDTEIEDVTSTVK
jgi:thiol-disulfide isomerase/thioredoxin